MKNISKKKMRKKKYNKFCLKWRIKWFKEKTMKNIKKSMRILEKKLRIKLKNMKVC